MNNPTVADTLAIDEETKHLIFCLYGKDQEIIFSIDGEGKAYINPSLDTDEAAHKFWDSVMQMIEASRAQLSAYHAEMVKNGGEMQFYGRAESREFEGKHRGVK